MADPASHWKTILEAFESEARSLTLLDVWNVKVFREPKLDLAWVDLPALVLAPRRDLQITVGKLNFVNTATTLIYDVFLGMFWDYRSQDPAQLWRRAADRQTVRENFWNPDIVNMRGSLGDYDVDFDPMGLGGEQPPANVVGGWERYSVSIKTRRQAS